MWRQRVNHICSRPYFFHLADIAMPRTHACTRGVRSALHYSGWGCEASIDPCLIQLSFSCASSRVLPPPFMRPLRARSIIKYSTGHASAMGGLKGHFIYVLVAAVSSISITTASRYTPPLFSSRGEYAPYLKSLALLIPPADLQPETAVVQAAYPAALSRRTMGILRHTATRRKPTRPVIQNAQASRPHVRIQSPHLTRSSPRSSQRLRKRRLP
ncbi:hypothetical protein JB92DRAFT_2958392 [Gautieria morchelliformis]|nr:hypothetical protein JB92DRAFT_2958392 [Gautieria morchelliformis]